MSPVCTTATLQPTWSQCYDGSRREAVPCEAVPEEALLRKHVHSPRARYYVVIPLLLLALVMSGASPRPAAGRTVPIAGNQVGVPPDARVLGPLPAGRPLRLIVGLAVRHPAVLAAFLHARRARSRSRRAV